MTLSGPIKVGHDQSPILFTINGVRCLVSIGSAQKNFAHDPERRRRRRYPPGTTCAWTSGTRSARPRPNRSIVCQRAPTVAAGDRVLSKNCNETSALRLCVSKGRPAASSAFGLPMAAPIFRVGGRTSFAHARSVCHAQRESCSPSPFVAKARRDNRYVMGIVTATAISGATLADKSRTSTQR